MMFYVLAVLLFLDLTATIIMDILLIREGSHSAGIFTAGISTVSLLLGYTMFVAVIARLNGHKHGFRAGMTLMALANGGEADIDRALEHTKAELAKTKTQIKVVDE